MWFPLALTAGFALAFLALYLAERRNIERDAAERQESARRAGIGQPQRLADATPSKGGIPQPAPLRSRRMSVGKGGGFEVDARVADVPMGDGTGDVADGDMEATRSS
jgi:hypothetical protein